ncbi:unnamed protein product [Cuscuta epithymum]|uniref:Reverse transcriptase zinc-binding domain-containing protein n=1 Tax=Cuscuta epithymum TaxID=186058 RepID=A0AAV0F6R4_9ASTE|nr:unnamed protein product [Cuscuta epithymum]
MQTYLLPLSICDRIDQLDRDFLWGHNDGTRKIHLVNWDAVCKPKDLGGLGIRKAQDNYLALVAKLGWEIMMGFQKLWVQIMKAKYIKKNSSFWEIEKKGGSSHTWRDILRSKNIIRNGLGWQVGNGERISFWFDLWVRDKPLHEELGSPLAASAHQVKVADLLMNNRDWNITKLETLLPEELLEDVRVIEDWSWVWKIRTCEKVRCFLWLVMKNKLLTNVERGKRHISEDTVCPLCNEDEETVLHIIRDCPFAVAVWRKSNLSLPRTGDTTSSCNTPFVREIFVQTH